jgi:hypothetical protein
VVVTAALVLVLGGGAGVARSEVETLAGEHGLVTSELVPTSFTAR